jgi:hypothetical protein
MMGREWTFFRGCCLGARVCQGRSLGGDVNGIRIKVYFMTGFDEHSMTCSIEIDRLVRVCMHCIVLGTGYTALARIQHH